MKKWYLHLVSLAVKAIAKYDYRYFFKSLQNIERSQSRVFHSIMERLAASEYGRAFGVCKEDSYSSFCAKVPIVEYHHIEQYVFPKNGHQNNGLSSEDILRFERTSGTTGDTKCIPFTRSHIRSFNRLCRIWFYDLLQHVFQPKTGRIFISVSPDFNVQSPTEVGIPIGVESDADYLTDLVGWLLKPFLVLDAKLRKAKTLEDFQYGLSLMLLAEEELEVISIWSPSYLIVLLKYMERNKDALLLALQVGCGRIQGEDDETIHLTFPRITPSRLNRLAAPSICWPDVWPQLHLISCWTAATAKIQARQLSMLFPGVTVQGKGLLATEAPLTVPLAHAPAPVPLVDEVFFEFEDESKRIRQLHELEDGQAYALIISQQGGLYRYRLGDLVQMKGYILNAPCLEFIGRANDCSDVTGEKLGERFVSECVSRLLQGKLGFYLLVPTHEANGPSRYVLLADNIEEHRAEELDQLLRNSYHFNRSRMFGQLGDTRIIRLDHMVELVHEFFITKETPWGDIKDRSLLSDPLMGQALVNAAIESRRTLCRGVG